MPHRRAVSDLPSAIDPNTWFAGQDVRKKTMTTPQSLSAQKFDEQKHKLRTLSA
ncbi:MAG: hypothetical protein WC749_01060 [Dehalococcoidia bacterium]